MASGLCVIIFVKFFTLQSYLPLQEVLGLAATLGRRPGMVCISEMKIQRQKVKRLSLNHVA